MNWQVSPSALRTAFPLTSKTEPLKSAAKSLTLPPPEYKLLAAMAKAPNRAFTRDQLIRFALDDEFGGYDRTIDTYIMTLRAKYRR
jgi:DNA-binding response OmpR family regulator